MSFYLLLFLILIFSILPHFIPFDKTSNFFPVNAPAAQIADSSGLGSKSLYFFTLSHRHWWLCVANRYVGWSLSLTVLHLRLPLPLSTLSLLHLFLLLPNQTNKIACRLDADHFFILFNLILLNIFSPFKVGRLRFKNIAPLYFLASAM